MAKCPNCKKRESLEHPYAQGMCNVCLLELHEKLDGTGIPELQRVLKHLYDEYGQPLEQEVVTWSMTRIRK